MSVCVIWWVAGPVVVILVVIYSYFIFLSVQSHDGGLRRVTQRDVFKVVLVYLALFLPNSDILILSPICSVPPPPNPTIRLSVYACCCFVTHQLNHILPHFTADHGLVHFVGVLNYTNKVISKVIIPHCSLQFPASQTLLGQLVQSRSHGYLVGEGGKEGQHRQECSGRK